MSDADRIIVLTIDALRADHLPFYGYHRDTAPFLTDLASESTVFSECYSASSHTRESMPVILSGQYLEDAVSNGYQFSGKSIASRLQVPSAMFHSNPFISRAYGYNDGFDAFDDDLYFGGNRLFALAKRAFDKLRNHHYARAEVINERALSWLNERSEGGFLLWNHYMDVHGPYQPPPAYQRRFRSTVVSPRHSQMLLQKSIRSPDAISERERETLIDLYDAEIRYVDDLLQSFVRMLRQRDDWDKTVLIVTADHGEAFGEDGYYEHPRRLSDALTKVPLVVHGPGWDAKEVSIFTSSLDLVPTMQAVLNHKRATVPGMNLQDIATSPDRYEGRTVVSQVSDKHSTTRRFRARRKNGEATARETGEDWSIEGNRAVRTWLREHIENRETDASVGDKPQERSAAIERRLKALGYLEDE